MTKKTDLQPNTPLKAEWLLFHAVRKCVTLFLRGRHSQEILRILLIVQIQDTSMRRTSRFNRRATSVLSFVCFAIRVRVPVRFTQCLSVAWVGTTVYKPRCIDWQTLLVLETPELPVSVKFHFITSRLYVIPLQTIPRKMGLIFPTH